MAPVHDLLTPLIPLLGTWQGRGTGSYPTIDSFDYLEEIVFAHVGKPFISYSQKTRRADTGAPLHAEAGYLRSIGEAKLELVLVQPTGIVELSEGVVSTGDVAASESADLAFELVTTAVPRTATAVEVTEVRRRLAVEGDRLRYDVAMAAAGIELTHHLSAELTRQS